MTKIVQEMINRFNKVLETEGSIIRLEFNEKKEHVFIGLVVDFYIQMSKQRVIPSDAFLDKVEAFFLAEGVSIEYNSDMTCFRKRSDESLRKMVIRYSTEESLKELEKRGTVTYKSASNNDLKHVFLETHFSEEELRNIDGVLNVTESRMGTVHV